MTHVISKKKTESSYLLYSLSGWECVGGMRVIFRWDIRGFHRGMRDIDRGGGGRGGTL